MVRPHLEYGNAIWFPFLKKDIELIEKVQMRATKLVPELKDLSYEDRLRQLKLPSLVHRRRRGDMIQTFKIIRELEDIPRDRFFMLSSSTLTRGHSLKIEKPRCNTTTRLRHFSQRVINDWNALPGSVVQAKDVNDFKTKLDKYWNITDTMHVY